MENTLVWNKGKPPHIGWWNASIDKNENMWRWWDGEYWSLPTSEVHTGYLAAERIALIKSSSSCDLVNWSHYWPENARVPRIDPNN